MEGLSRRDQVYHQVGVLADAMRHPERSFTLPARSLTDDGSGSPRESVSYGSPGHPGRRNSSASTYHSSPPFALDRLTNNLLAAVTNNPDIVSHSAAASPRSPYTSTGPIPYNSITTEPPAFRLPDAALGQSTTSLAPSIETLPGYAPHPHPGAQIKYRHTLSSASDKVTVELDSVGSKDHPVYIQGVFSTVTGRVILNLQGDENVSELRIRVKGGQRCTVGSLKVQ